MSFSVSKDAIYAKIKSEYESKTHKEVKITVNADGSTTQSLEEVSNKLDSGVDVLVDSIISAIMSEVVDKIALQYDTHTHSNGNQGAPTGPPLV
jgi:hypothetical protein